MDNISLKVQCRVGVMIDDAAKDCVELARHLNIMVETEFSGITLLIVGDDDPRDISRAYYRAIDKKLKVAVAEDAYKDD